MIDPKLQKAEELYEEMTSFVKSLPSEKELSGAAEIINHYNDLVDELGDALEEDYSKFHSFNSKFATAENMRSVATLLLSKINHKLSVDANGPDLSSIIQTSKNQTISLTQFNNQTQVMVSVVVELNEKIKQAEKKYKKDGKVKAFLNSVKIGLSNALTVGQIILLLHQLAIEHKIDNDILKEIFS